MMIKLVITVLTNVLLIVINLTILEQKGKMANNDQVERFKAHTKKGAKSEFSMMLLRSAAETYAMIVKVH